MFERFTNRARQVVVLAQEEARSLRHGWIGTEHLLLALLREREGVAGSVLAAAGVTADDVRADVRRIVGEGGGAAPCSPDDPSPDDAAALRSIGIDLDAVRARIEETFGPGALEVVRQARPPRWRRRRGRRGRPCATSGPWLAPTVGHIPFTPRSKKVLELALREAIRLHDGEISTEHILLGLLREGEGLAAEILVQRGVRLDDLRQRVLAAIGKVA